MQFSTIVIHLIGYIIYATSMIQLNILFHHRDLTSYVKGDSLCPHALFLQAQSHYKLTVFM